MAGSTKTCTEIHPLLLDFVLGELDKQGDDYADVLAHLESCEDCQQRAGELKRTTRMLQAVGRRSEPDPVFEDQVAQLAHAEAAHVRESSRREPEGTRRATPAARAPWWLLLAAAAFAVALAWLVPALGLLGGAPRAVLEPHAGVVEIVEGNGRWRPCPRREEISAGAAVRVAGAGLARLDLGGAGVLLGPGAEILLPERGNAALRLRAGSAFFNRPGLAVEIAGGDEGRGPAAGAGPASGCRIEGSRACFAVSLEGAPDRPLVCACESGEVRVAGRMGQQVRLRPGQGTRLDATGRLARPRSALAAERAPWRFAFAGEEALRRSLGPGAEFLDDGRVRLVIDLGGTAEPGGRWEDLFPVAGKSPWQTRDGWMKAELPGVLALDLPLLGPASVELTIRPGPAAAGAGFLAPDGRCWLYRPGAKDERGAAAHRLDQGPLKGLRTVLAPGEPFAAADTLRARVALGPDRVEVFAGGRAVNRAQIRPVRSPVRAVLWAGGACAFRDLVVVGHLDPDWAARELGGEPAPPPAPPPAAR